MDVLSNKPNYKMALPNHKFRKPLSNAALHTFMETKCYLGCEPSLDLKSRLQLFHAMASLGSSMQGLSEVVVGQCNFVMCVCVIFSPNIVQNPGAQTGCVE